MKATGGARDHDHTIADIDDVLRAHGLRRTPQRQATLEAIAESKGHATAEEIFRRVHRKLPTVSASTIYRALASLEEVGVLCHAHLGHTASVYHVGTAGLHQHLVCEGCGSLQEVEGAVTAAFAKRLEDRFGFRANFTHFAVLGLCARCARGTSGRRPRAAAAKPSRR